MTEPLSTVCDHCGACLKLKNPDLEGKKIKCPKCEEAFVVRVSSPAANRKPAKKKPAVDDDDPGFMDVDPDDYDAAPPDDDDSDDGEERQSRRSRSLRTGKKKPKKSRRSGNSGGAQAIKIGAIVLVLLVVLGGGGYGLTMLVKASATSDVDWLPADIQGYVKIQADDLWKAGVVQQFANGEAGKKLVEEMTKNIGLGPQDVDSITVGFTQTGRPGSEVTVMRSRVPFDKSKLMAAHAGTQETSHEGKIYMKNDVVAIFLADGKTLIRSNESNIQSLITRQSESIGIEVRICQKLSRSRRHGVPESRTDVE